MKILLIAMPTTLEYIVPLLEEDGHVVKLITGKSTDDNSSVDPFGDWTQEIKDKNTYLRLHFAEKIHKDYITAHRLAFQPDTIVNAVTPIILSTSSEYTYLGNSEASAKLETHKWDARTKAGELGWSLPTILEECDMDAVSDWDQTVYVKPKGDTPIRQIYKVPASTNNAEHNWSMPSNTPAYVEASVDYEVEAWCNFTVSNGSYSIIRTLGCTGFGDDKLLESSGNWKEGNIKLVDLTDSQKAAFIAKCEAWLDYVVTLGGNYEGCLGGAITSDNTVYWFEQNSRPGTYNIGMLPGTIQDWLDGLTTDSTKSINQISAETIRSERGFG